MSAKIILPGSRQIIGDSSGTNPLVLKVSTLSPAGYLNARYPADFTLVGSAITTWASRGTGGTGWNASDNSVVNHRPTYVTGAYASFDGVTNTLTSIGTLAFNQPSTIALMMRIRTGAATNGTACDGTTLNTRRIYISNVGTLSLGMFSGGSGFTVASAFTLDTIIRCVGVFNGASSSLTTSVVATTTGTVGAGAANGWDFATSNAMAYDLFAAASFASALNSSQIALLINTPVWL